MDPHAPGVAGTERQEEPAPGLPAPGPEPAPAAPAARALPERDLMFVRIALRAGALPAARGEEALAALVADEALRADALCVARGWLTPAQARAVLSHVDAPEEATARPDEAADASFDRLVALKRRAEEGDVKACAELARELAGSAYERLGDLLLRKAQQRARGPAVAAGAVAPTRGEAFDLYVRLKQAAQRGDSEEATRLAALLADDPEYGRLAQAQATRAFARRALSAARTQGGLVVRCAACGTPTAGGGGHCLRCGAPTTSSDAAPPTTG